MEPVERTIRMPTPLAAPPSGILAGSKPLGPPRLGLWGALGLFLLAGAAWAQESGGTQVPPQKPPQGSSSDHERLWKEGAEIRLRVPIASDSAELMTTVAFPETGIRSAITGWGQNALTIIQKGNLLFLRLSKRAEGQLRVIGDSGTVYLLTLEAVDPKAQGGIDAYIKIVRAPAEMPGALTVRQVPGGPRARPKGALELIRQMRLGEPREGARILRAKGELVFESDDAQLRLLYIYDAFPYIGRIYEVRNRSTRKLLLDASRFRASGEELILSGLRENVIPPGGVSRLYTVYWRP